MSYFDSLVLAQVDHLSAVHAQLSKTARIGNAEEKVTLTPDRKVWENELAAFGQLRVFERPVYRSAYLREEDEKDESSNLLIRSYRAKYPVPVTELRFFYHRNFAGLKRIEAVYTEKNSLYLGSRKLSMEFEEAQGGAVLTAYELTGIQKMVLNDTVHFSIRGTIRR